jgi:uncharacterized Zn finger protein
MCKHVAAVLYGVGARLDKQPELLFKLHEVDEKELIAQAGDEYSLLKERPAALKVLSDTEDLSALFGLDMAQNTVPDGKAVDRAPSMPPQIQSENETPKRSAKKKAGRAKKARSAGKGARDQV